jgi:hypothetical protein
MLQFCTLDLNDQISLVMQNTKIVPLNELQHNGAILAHAIYDPHIMNRSIHTLMEQSIVADKLLQTVQSVLMVILQESFHTKYRFDTKRGFVLQRNGRNVFICNNIRGYDSTQVIVISLDEFENELRIDYSYGEKVPNRWKMLYSGFAFGIVCLLMDAANKITFPIL